MTTEKTLLRKIWDERATLTQKEFGKKYGIGSVAMVSQYLLGRRPLNLAAAIKFARGLGVQVADIAPDLAKLASIAATASNVEPAPVGTKMIRVVGFAHAGDPNSGDPEYGYIPVDMDDVSTVYGYRIEGDSMLPEFHEGDVVIMDSEIVPEPGDFVAARIHGENDITFKRYVQTFVDQYGRTQFELVPLNDNYPTMSSTELEIDIDSVMIEHRSFRRNRKRRRY